MKQPTLKDKSVAPYQTRKDQGVFTGASGGVVDTLIVRFAEMVLALFYLLLQD